MDSSEQGSPPLLRPKPRRPYEIAVPNSNNSAAQSSTTALDQSNGQDRGEKEQMPRSRSVANLTASTLFGIYTPSSFETPAPSQPTTPRGTGAETPLHRGSADGLSFPRHAFREEELEVKLLKDELRAKKLGQQQQLHQHQHQHQSPQSLSRTLLSQLLQISVLFVFGLAYGNLIAHFHNDRDIAPVKMDGLNRESWRYLAFWGAASVAGGLLLPWVDNLTQAREMQSQASKKLHSSVLISVKWNDVVRSVGAFIGVAYAIRKTPWSSPLQLSATLTLVNPFLWYLLDRTITGLAFSTLTAIFSALVILLVNPSWVPSPSPSLISRPNVTNSAFHQNLPQRGNVPLTVENFLSSERIGLAIWIGSVFFCSCICVGNIGRLLAPRSRNVKR